MQRDVGRIHDLLAMRRGGRDRPRRQLVRIVECIDGEVEVDVLVAARFDFGMIPPWLRVHDDGLLLQSLPRDGEPGGLVAAGFVADDDYLGTNADGNDELFIFDLKWMAHPRTAVRGNFAGALGMATFVDTGIEAVIVFGFVVGFGVMSGGALAAQTGTAFWFIRRRALAISLILSAE